MKSQRRIPAPAGRHLCRMATKINPSSVRSGIFRPAGALNLSRFGFYKDSAPDGAWIGCRTQAGIPIPAVPGEQPKPVERLVERILSAKGGTDIPVCGAKENTDRNVCVTALERELDELVYALYGLTPEEKALVQAAAK